MKTLIENIRRWGVLVLITIGLFLFFKVGLQFIGYWIFCILPIFVFLLYFYINRKSKEITHIQHLLIEECDPDAFISAWEAYDKNKKNNYQLHLVAQANISLGYFYKGEIKKGISHLMIVNEDNTIKKTFPLSYTIYHNLAYMYLFDEQFDQAKLYIEKQKQLITEQILVQVNSHKIDQYKKQTEQLEKVLDINENRLDSVLEYFLHKLKDDKDILSLVTTKYYLFLVYEKLQNIDAQHECMEFIKEKGNRLFLREIAYNWLKSH